MNANELSAARALAADIRKRHPKGSPERRLADLADLIIDDLDQAIGDSQVTSDVIYDVLQAVELERQRPRARRPRRAR